MRAHDYKKTLSRSPNPDGGGDLLQAFATKVALSDNFSRLDLSLDDAAYLLADFALRSLGPLVTHETGLTWASKALRDHTPVTDPVSASKGIQSADRVAHGVLSRLTSYPRDPLYIAALRAIGEVCYTAKHQQMQTPSACLAAMEKVVVAGVPAETVANAARRFLGQALRPQAVRAETVGAGAPRSSILGDLRSMFSFSPGARTANPGEELDALELASRDIIGNAYEACGNLSYHKGYVEAMEAGTRNFNSVLLDIGAMATAAYAKQAADGALAAEMAIHAARAAGAPVSGKIKDLAFDAQVKAQRAALCAQNLKADVKENRTSLGALEGLIEKMTECYHACREVFVVGQELRREHGLAGQGAQRKHEGRTPNHHRTGILSEDYPMDPYNKDLDKAFDPYDRYWRTGNPSALYSVAIDGRPVYSSHLKDQAMRRFMHQRDSGRGEVTLSIDGDVAYRVGKGGAMRVGNPLRDSDGRGYVNGYFIGEREDLYQADLAGMNLRGADLGGADLREADLRGADLSYADLEEARLFRAKMTGAILTKARLSLAKMKGAILTGADLTEADLTGANLTEADLTGANLTGANLEGADLTGANLTGAKLEGAKLEGAKLEGATMPDGRIFYGSVTNAYLVSAPKNSAGVRKPIVCGNGLRLSVQAGEYTYCAPKTSTGPWATVEVGYPSRVISELLPYADTEDDPLNSVYAYVPVEVLDVVIAKNGGIAGR